MTPEEEKAIRERAADADIRTFSPQASQAVIDRHDLLAELDAARAENARLTAAVRAVADEMDEGYSLSGPGLTDFADRLIAALERSP